MASSNKNYSITKTLISIHSTTYSLTLMPNYLLLKKYMLNTSSLLTVIYSLFYLISCHYNTLYKYHYPVEITLMISSEIYQILLTHNIILLLVNTCKIILIICVLIPSTPYKVKLILMISMDCGVWLVVAMV